MKIDLTKLDSDLRVAKSKRRVDVGPGGLRRTGAMDVVRNHLDALQRRHDAGATWVEIAAGLANQGVSQGDGVPITGKRLTALIASVRQQEARLVAKAARRVQRADVVVEEQPVDASGHRLRLATELTAVGRPSMSRAPQNAEDALRHENYEKHSKFFRKDPE